MNEVAGLIAAAGSSRRMGGQQKKEYLEIDGCPVLVLAIRPFLELSPAMTILVTVPEGHIDTVRQMLQAHLPGVTFLLAAGGSSRQQSVRNGLEALREIQPRHVLIHDAARPWVTRALIERVLRAARLYGACIPALEACEAPKLVGPSGLILRDLDRGRVRLAQTPQGFLYAGILEAHRRASTGGRHYVDDAEVYARYCGPVFTVSGDPQNRKITYPEDLRR